jgi:1,4-alpha-glucan branching enzyme
MKLSTVNVPTLHPGAIDAIAGAYHGDPFSVLGMHQVGEHLVVRVFRPGARAISVQDLRSGGQRYPGVQVHGDGFFEVVIEGQRERFPYELYFQTGDGHEWHERDPYSFGQVMGEVDMHLFSEGQNWELYRHLGAQVREFEGVRGTSFVVWAPNAQRVSVVGDFNHWDGRVHPMRKLINCGLWEIFLPGIGAGAHYKFEVKNCWGQPVLKADPFAFFSQHGVQTSSLVYDLHQYTWKDEEWMKKRAETVWHKAPVSIYEVHLGSWRRKPEEGDRFLSYREMADELVDYVSHMGYTHIELMPVAEHPFEGSWGYQVTGYFAPTSRFGSPDEFRYFVDRAHERGIGIILDWVPGHFPKDVHGLADFDGTDLYEHSDPRLGEHMDWGTLIFNYGRNEVRNFLISNGLFWLEQYHIDGLRVDAVASMLYLDYSRKAGEWIPNIHGGRENLEAIYFLKRFNEVAYERNPGIMTIAEESTAWPGVSRPTYLGGLGFGFKWNMGWMHDFLQYMSREPVHRRFHQGDITFSLIYAFHEHFILVLSHDEVVHGKGALLNKMPGDLWQKFANLRMFYAWMYAHPGKKLLFMGGEFGQWREWNHNQSLDWHLNNWPEHDGLKRLVQHLNHLYRSEPALYDLDDTYEGFEWIDFHDSDNSVVAFKRKSQDGDVLVFIVNATPIVREAYRIGVNGEGYYAEVLNTDAQTYGGGNVGNMGGARAEPIAWQGKSHSLLLRLPPLAVVGLKQQKSHPAEPVKVTNGSK